MTSHGFVCGTLLCAFAASLAAAPLPSPVPAYGKLPLRFEPNHGQSDSSVRYLARGGGYTMLFRENDAIFYLGAKRPSRLRLQLQGAQSAKPEPDAPLSGVTNYLTGNDPSRWRTNIGSYARLRYQQVYPGIDLVYYGNQKQIEFDFELQPGADPAAIRLHYDGASKLRLSRTGELLVETPGGTLVQHKPVAYQMVNGKRVERASRYALRGGTASFVMGVYDRNLPLVIDPILSYSTYLGGAGGDAAYGIALDATGAAYIVGQTTSANFPTQGPIAATSSGDSDVFVAKLSPNGNSLAYSTYLGGSGEDVGTGIAVNATGAYITGYTTSNNFPMQSAIDSSLAGARDAFVAKLSPSGNALLYSTYLGGSNEERGLGIAIDTAGAAYVAGVTDSPNFPTVNAAFGTFSNAQRDAFVTKIAADGASLSYSTYLGGNDDDAALGIAVDTNSNAYVTGYTRSTNFPMANPISGTNAGGFDVFVTKLSIAGAVGYSTYLGGSGNDRANAIAVDASGAAFVAGWTFSSNYPTVFPYSNLFSGNYEGFVSKLNPAGSALTFSTYLGGNGEDFISSIAIDGSGAAVVAGYSSSSNFPSVATSLAYSNGRTNGAFVTRFTPAGSGLEFSTYVGGAGADQANAVATDSNRSIYAVGSTFSIEFPAVSAFQSNLQGSTDAFAVKFAEGTPLTTTILTNPAGLNIVVDGVTTTAPRFLGWAAGTSHTLSAPSPQGAGATRYTFSSWSQGGAQTQNITASASDTTYTAQFTTQHQLTLNVNPSGAGAINPSPAAGDGFFAAGTGVQLSAVSAPGYAFTGFTGDLSGNVNPQTVTVSAPRTVTANFSCTYELSATSGQFDGGAGNGSFNIATGSGCSFTASTLAEWVTITGGGVGPGSRTLSYQVAANFTTSTRTATINITTANGVLPYTITQGPQPPASITVNTVPTGLQFTMDGTTFTAPRTFQFLPGSAHEVSAISPQTTSGVRQTFAHWSDGGARTHQVIAPVTGALNITANFSTTYQLSTIVQPVGSGTLTLVPQSPDGFYAPGTNVSIGAGSSVSAVFSGFSGALNGNTNPQILAMDGPKTVIATFVPQTCGSNYGLTPQHFSAPNTGGTFTVTVTTGAGCFWNATLSAAFVDPWITVPSNASATGTNTFTFTVAPNTTAFPRTASINIQGQLVQVAQAGTNVVTAFTDVPPDFLFFDYITLMNRYGNSTGCGNSKYCPEDVTTRGAMAELIIRARFGADFPFLQTPFFTDVPATHPQYRFIQKMKELGITEGCTTTTYCPGDAVTRGQMSVFLIRTRLGVLTPQQFTYNATPLFTDVSSTFVFFPYIQKMKELGITAGCTATTFCEGAPNTLGQMAVFVIRAFNTP